MGSRVKYLLSEVEATYLKLKCIYKEIGEANYKGKRGRVQQLVHTRKYLYKKLLTLKEKFNNLLKGTICNIKYEYIKGQDKVTSTALLVNVTDEEIDDILRLYCKFHDYIFIRVLEIQRIPTKFC